MKRFLFNKRAVEALLDDPRFSEFNTFVFYDTETTKWVAPTPYGLEWYNKILTIQVGIIDRQHKTFQKTLRFFMCEGGFSKWFSYLSALKKDTLVLGWNLEYDLLTTYRNMYFDKLKSSPEALYEDVPPFQFKVLDLMHAYDYVIGALFGKPKDRTEESGKKFDEIATLKHLPIIPLKVAGEQTNSIEVMKAALLSALNPHFNPYGEISFALTKSANEGAARSDKIDKIKRKIIETFREGLSLEEAANFDDLDENEQYRMADAEKQIDKPIEDEDYDSIISSLEKDYTGVNAKFWLSLSIGLRVSKKLKHVISILEGKHSDNLEEDVGWKNAEVYYPSEGSNRKNKYEFCFIIDEVVHKQDIEEMMTAAKNNIGIVIDAFENPTTSKFLRYAEHDIDYLLEVFFCLGFPYPTIPQQETIVQSRLAYLGLPIDEEKIRPMIQKISSVEDSVSKTAAQLNGGVPVNLKSPKQKRIFFSKITGREITKSDKKTAKELSMDESLPKDVTDFFKEMSSLGKKTFLLKQLHSLLLCKKSGVHPTERLHATTTYRKTSKGINTAGITRDSEDGKIRSVFLTTGGGDQKAAEVAGLAVTIQDPVLLDAIEKGLDLHSKILGMMEGIPYEEVVRIYNDKSDPKHAKIAADRTEIKKTTFASFYGGTPEGIAKKNGVSEEFVAKVIETLKKAYPKFAEYLECTDSVNVYHKIIQDWNSAKARIDALPIGIRNIFGIISYQLTEMLFQQEILATTQIVAGFINRVCPDVTVVRTPEKGPQRAGDTFRSAGLGAISRLQGDAQRRLMNFPIQSYVSFTTKTMKVKMYEKLLIPIHDVHDEVIVPRLERLTQDEKNNIKNTFYQVLSELQKNINPVLGWNFELMDCWIH